MLGPGGRPAVRDGGRQPGRHGPAVPGGVAGGSDGRSGRSARAELAAAAKPVPPLPDLLGPSICLNNLGLEAPLLLMVAMYGTGVGGQFALAQRIVALPVRGGGRGLGQVYFAEAARVRRDDPTPAPAVLEDDAILALTAIGPFLLGASSRPFLFGMLFGQAWSEAGLYVAILAPMYFLQFVPAPTGGTLDVLERQDLHLVREIGRLFLIGGAVLVAAALHLSASRRSCGVSIAGCVTTCLYGYISWRAIVLLDRRPLQPAT